MSLELLVSGPAREGTESRTPLLFVHGAFANAALWAEYFLPYFASQGFPAYAVSLRGHGGSRGQERLATLGLEDYVRDVTETVHHIEAGTGRTPVLIGHSMGGMVVQKACERVDVPGMVLMASVPPYGITHSAFYLAFTRPHLYGQIMLLQAVGPAAARPTTLRGLMFGDRVPAADIERFFGLMQRESRRVAFDMLGFNPPRPIWVGRARRPPVLVLGAGRDAMLPIGDVFGTAAWYGVRPVIIDTLAHGMMVDTDWEKAAEALMEWLDSVEF